MGSGTGKREWQIRCCRCGSSRPLGKGVVRLGAWSWKKFTVGRCPDCRRFGFQAIERRPPEADLLIRDETPADADAVAAVTVAAFATLEVSNQTEHHVVAALREAGALAVSLVAERDGRIVGHIAFSPVTLSDGTPDWYGLGPVSVLPELQGRGIGGTLIRRGLERLAELGARGCCLVGHPEYYPRFGFAHHPQLVLEGVPPEAFMALSLDGHVPRGTVVFHEGFAADGRPEGSGAC